VLLSMRTLELFYLWLFS